MTSHDAAPTAVVSYGHTDPEWDADQARRRTADVVRLVRVLREHGIDADADVFHPNEDWTRWGPQRVGNDDFVLIIASRAWCAAWTGEGDERTNRGLRDEADAVRSIKSRGRSQFQARCRVVLLPGAGEDDIPPGMEGLARHRIDFGPASVETLVRDLTGQPPHVLPPLGERPHLPPISEDAATPTPRGTATPASGMPRTDVGRWRPAPPVTLDRSASWAGWNHQGITRAVVHLVPLPQAPFSQRRLTGIDAAMARAMREQVDASTVLRTATTGDLVAVEADWPKSRYGQVVTGRLLGCRVGRSGQLSIWSSLPRDGMGSVLDGTDLAKDLTRALRVAATVLSHLGVEPKQQVVVATELDDLALLTGGELADLGRRTSATMPFNSWSTISLDPDESVPLMALSGTAAVTTATTVADVLVSTARR